MIPNPILTIGPFHVYMYGLMIAVGVLCAFIVLDLYGKKKKLYPSTVDFTFYWALVCIVVGFFSAVLFQSIYDYVETGVFSLDGDMTFMGGLIGALVIAALGFILFGKRYPHAFIQVVDIIPLGVTVAHGFGRLGCFFAGCCYGIESESWLAVQFPGMAHKVLPTQLFESAFLFVLFAVMSILYLKKNCRRLVSVYLIAYGVFRFLIEFIRDDYRGEFVGTVTPSQFWSLVFVAIGIVVIIVAPAIIRYAEAKPASEAELSSVEKAKDAKK